MIIRNNPIMKGGITCKLSNDLTSKEIYKRTIIGGKWELFSFTTYFVSLDKPI